MRRVRIPSTRSPRPPATPAPAIAVMLASFVMILLATPACTPADGAQAGGASPRRGLVILGVDGMDPVLTRGYLAAGKLPHLVRLSVAGTFVDLATSNPPQSPVAWSHFITGRSAAAHGIYDFVHRDPIAMAPYLSTSRAEAPALTLPLGPWRVPLGGGGMRLLRKGEPFWARLAAAGVPTTIVKIPAHFPPTDSGQGLTLSGMGTPDLLGTYGTFQVLTDDPALAARTIPAARMHRLVLAGSEARAQLEGPPSPLHADERPLTVPVTVSRNRAGSAAVVRVGDSEALLTVGEWSAWLPIAFDPGPVAGSIKGMVRFLVKALVPHIVLYASPINVDPTAPAVPISSPPGYAAELAADAGRFYTQGMPEDTKALESGVLSDDEFLAQAALVFAEERALLRRELGRYRAGGFLFHYLSLVDQVSHVFFRALDPAAPPELARHAGVIEKLYADVDALVGEVVAALPPGTALLVLSDHGFAPFRFKVNLNTWLMQQGYLRLRERPAPGALGHIDWTRTQAYALGLNQVFINRRGREAEGVVAARQAPALLDRLARALETWVDPISGGRVVTRTFRPGASQHPERTPDLIVGFARGYRSSEASGTGMPEASVVVANHDKWSGDHCIDPALVPGVLFSSERLAPGPASLLDIAPTVLGHFGLGPPAGAEGKSLLPSSSPNP